MVVPDYRVMNLFPPIPESLFLLNPPSCHFERVDGPIPGLFSMFFLNACEKLVFVPLFEHIQLVGILFQIGKLERIVAGKRHDYSERHSGGVDTQ